MVNSNTFSTEINLNRRGLVAWSLAVSALIVVYLGSYSFIVSLGVVELLEFLPEAITTALGLGPETFRDVNTFHGSQVLLYVLLPASIYAMRLASSLVTRDIDLGTVEFLYTRPLMRRTIFLSKAVAFLVMMTLLWIVAYLVSSAVGVLWVAPGEFDLFNQFTAHLKGYLACLAAGGIAFSFSPFLDRVQSSRTLALILGLAFFVLNSLSKVFNQLDFLKFFSIYYYADTGGAASGDLFIAGAVVCAVLFAAGSLTGAFLMDRKDFIA